jgi:hypothetical protein
MGSYTRLALVRRFAIPLRVPKSRRCRVPERELDSHSPPLWAPLAPNHRHAAPSRKGQPGPFGSLSLLLALREQFEHAPKATTSKLQIPRWWQRSLLAFLQSFHCRSQNSMLIQDDYRRRQNRTLTRIETIREAPPTQIPAPYKPGTSRNDTEEGTIVWSFSHFAALAL